MGDLCKLVVIILVLMAELHYTSGGKKGTVSKTVPRKPPEKPSQGTKTQSNHPRQPSNPGAGRNPGYPNQQYPGRGGSSTAGYPNQNPGAGSYPAGGSYPYPGRGGSSPGGYPNQNPGAGSYPAGGSYPSAGGNPNQYPGRGGSSPGGYPNQNPGAGSYPAGGSYPSAGGNFNQNPGRDGSSPGGYPNQNPGAGSFPAGGSYPSAGGNPNQYPGRGGSSPGGYPNQNPGRGGSSPGGYPNQNPGAGSYPGGGYPNQYPGRGGSSPGGYPNQNPGAGTYPAGGYPNQYPGGGGYSNQHPGRSGYSPGGYPGAGSYPVRNSGQPGVYPGAHPSAGGGYPNWNPNNQILSPRYGGSFGGGGFGKGGSPFSQSVKNMGYVPSAKSKDFGKKAVGAAGVGAMAGMAIGYGIGNFQRPNFQFRSPQEERYYNNHMYRRQDTRSKDGGNKKNPSHTAGTDNTSKLPAQAQSYDQFMNTCMKRNNLLRDQDSKDFAGNSNIQRVEPLNDIPGLSKESFQKGGTEKNDTASPTTTQDYPKAAEIHKDEDEDTVSIMQIGYPALIDQMKSRKCVELYIVYSESRREGEIPRSSDNHNGHSISEVLLLLTTSTMLFSTT